MTDSLTLAIEGLETLVADSPTFRAKLGVDSGAGHREKAARYIYWFSQSLEQDLYKKPAAIIAFGGAALVEFGQGEKMLLGTASEVVLMLAAPSEGRDSKPSGKAFLAFAGGVFDDIGDNSGNDYGTGVYFPFSSGRTLFDPRRTELKHRNAGVDYWLTGFAFENHI